MDDIVATSIVSPNVRIRHPDHFAIGDYSIVDDFGYFSTRVRIGVCSHIASGCSVAGGVAHLFTLGDFSSLSSGVKIWCTSDDFTNDIVTVIPPGVEDVKQHTIAGDVSLANCTAVGANSVVMPNNHIPEGTVIGALSFVPAASALEPWSVYAGCPVRLTGRRNREAVMAQAQLLRDRLDPVEESVTANTRQIAWWTPLMTGGEDARVVEVLRSNYVNEGEVTVEFERRIASLFGVSHAVATTSGTTAIFLALAAVGVGQGDEVIVPDVTFIATANAVRLTGATPVLVDIDPRTLNIDPEQVRQSITPKTKAIVPVHVSGRSADMPALLSLADAHGLAVIEDAAEALLSSVHGRTLGTLGAAGCLSFSPNKTITTGQGGMVLTNDADLAARLRALKDHGRPVRGTGGNDEHPTLGFNFKLTNLQSAVGLAQAEQLESRVARLKTIYCGYKEGLRDIPGVRLPGFDIEDGEAPQWVDAIVDRRDDLVADLLARGIHCRPFWYPLHTQHPYRRPDSQFPVSSRLMPQALWLPSALSLTDADVASVCSAIREFYAAR